MVLLWLAVYQFFVTYTKWTYRIKNFINRPNVAGKAKTITRWALLYREFDTIYQLEVDVIVQITAHPFATKILSIHRLIIHAFLYILCSSFPFGFSLFDSSCSIHWISIGKGKKIYSNFYAIWIACLFMSLTNQQNIHERTRKLSVAIYKVSVSFAKNVFYTYCFIWKIFSFDIDTNNHFWLKEQNFWSDSSNSVFFV